MSVKHHYDSHLGNFYSWMAGDFAAQQQAQQAIFKQFKIKPPKNNIAVDLGCGHGLHAVSLANLGFSVVAIDFNKQLLQELKSNKGGLDIDVIEDDFTKFKTRILTAGLAVCMGDTIAHLPSVEVLLQFFKDVYERLEKRGKFIVSYRDYGVALTDEQRFIPVRSDENQIHTCFLEYFADRVRVTDILHQKDGKGWKQSASSYYKLRLDRALVDELLEKAGFTIDTTENINRMWYCVAKKG
ncbi:MAG: class I SAM-dependent methyltransferase [Bacteroidetes bacterium]|nr:MAG: class I SAM-dependent methyltransferase [Bacteroidota bacterium]